MNPPDHNPTNLPQQIHGEASARRPDTEPIGAPKAQIHPDQVKKPRSQPLGEGVFTIVYPKAIAATRKLEYLNLPKDTLDKAAKTLATKKTHELLGQVLRYALGSARSKIIKDVDILTEIGINTMELCPEGTKKKGSTGGKKGGRHGS